MTQWIESAEAIGAVDDILAAVGMTHGNRKTLAGTWKDGLRLKALKTSSPAAATGKKRAPGVVPIPAWEQHTWLRAGFSTRHGGVSTAYSDGNHGELNLGFTPADDPANVSANRKRFLRAVLGPNPNADLATTRQFHSGMIRIIDPNYPPLATPEGKATLRGDALLTNLPNLVLGIQTADCIPILIADKRTHAVAAFHAGWRGTLARIVERGIGTMRLRYGSRPQDLIAAIGPGIGPCCYAVGEEVRFDFESQFAYAPTLFSEVYDSDPIREKYPLLFLTARAPGHSNIGPQIHIDLWEANRRQLLDAGLKPKNITVIGECTGCAREKNGTRRYFSHRIDHGYTGRMMALITALN